jgi:hypothetical protein
MAHQERNDSRAPDLIERREPLRGDPLAVPAECLSGQQYRYLVACVASAGRKVSTSMPL